MFFLILDKDPNIAIDLIPKRLRFKQLMELSQLICSTEISNIFKPVKQGKELQNWILKNSYWTYKYYEKLLQWCLLNIKLKEETKEKFYKIEKDLYNFSDKNIEGLNIKSIVFRYVKEYKSEYESNSELPISIGLEEYRKYKLWKEEQYDIKKYKCVMPEQPYCPCCKYGSEYREPWWEDGNVKWICGLKGITKKQKRIIEERNRYYQ